MRDDISRREIVKAGLAGALMLEASAHGQAERDQANVPDDEFVHVAPDHWSFETIRTRRRFIPFGANLVLTSKEDLDIFGRRYGSPRYDRILAACEKLRVNPLKVFLPVGSLLPDPQYPGEITLWYWHHRLLTKYGSLDAAATAAAEDTGVDGTAAVTGVSSSLTPSRLPVSRGSILYEESACRLEGRVPLC